jgi:hypothetical protein
MIASIPRIQSALNFFMNGVSIRKGCSQIFEFFHPFKGFSIYCYVVTLSSIFLQTCKIYTHIAVVVLSHNLAGVAICTAITSCTYLTVTTMETKIRIAILRLASKINSSSSMMIVTYPIKLGFLTKCQKCPFTCLRTRYS